METGRWTILSRARPMPRRPSCSWRRERVNVRCVCGHESTVWLEDVEAGRSTGCSSRRCFARHKAMRDVRVLLVAWIERERAIVRTLAEGRSAAQRRDFERAAEQLATEATAKLDHQIAAWLRAPLEVEDLDDFDFDLDVAVTP